MKRICLVIILLLAAVAGSAQDAITVGVGGALPGQSVSVPVWIDDRSTNSTLNSDGASGVWIQGFAFKVLYPPELISAVTFSRAGATASLTPLYELTQQGEGWISYLGSFDAAGNRIELDLAAPAPGNLVGELQVTVRGDAAPGAIATLQIEPAGATLSNQAGTITETVANGFLTLFNGSITVASLAAPPNLVATGVGRTHIALTWTAVANADHYEIWRRENGGAYRMIATAAGTSHNDSFEIGYSPSYLYRVRAVDAGGGVSAFSNPDVATIYEFVDDPLVPGVHRIRAVHFAQLRHEINALRITAGLAPLPTSPTVYVAGAPVLAEHLTELRTALHEARAAAGLPAVALSDATITPGVTKIKAVHVQQLRDALK